MNTVVNCTELGPYPSFSQPGRSQTAGSTNMIPQPMHARGILTVDEALWYRD